MSRVAVVGATGYAGGELVALLARHPRAELTGVFASPGGSAVPFAALHPSLASRRGPRVAPFSPAAMRGAAPDVVFLATPNEASADLVPALLESGIRVVDLSGAYRLSDAESYPKWYGFAHPAPHLLKEAVYGLSEWCDGTLRGARLVANPGCYPTSVVLPLRPLAPILAPGAPIVCDSASGVSGAGKKADLAFSFAELAGNFKAYGVGTHRHEPEMRQALGLADEASFVFVPHLLPLVRGILTTLHVSFDRSVAAEEVAELFSAAYASAPFVRLRPAGELPELKDVVGTPRAEIGFVLLPGGRRAVLVSAIDNLLKGAASQAVQNFNRMSDFEETEGLQ
ncbi:MAG TPA: N-acetyl-gamma-glutamyl-phosphate reductase [Thermoanaerobaculia bacterium]|nr:N-acetyl-gamma-glutamyl-phosphate reductase [Thermoanaerobaculia bacterium]